jgi:hypothetical protein
VLQMPIYFIPSLLDTSTVAPIEQYLLECPNVKQCARHNLFVVGNLDFSCKEIRKIQVKEAEFFSDLGYYEELYYGVQYNKKGL